MQSRAEFGKFFVAGIFSFSIPYAAKTPGYRTLGYWLNLNLNC
jgi:hypothetical protein